MNSPIPFPELLAQAVRKKKTAALVGLDPRLEHLPPPLQPRSKTPQTVANAYREFCCHVIDVVAPLVPAVKPQSAFFEQIGPLGCQALADVTAYAKNAGLLVILDGKRNDIGTTAEAYADAYLGAHRAPWSAHALTVNPYLGSDSLEPFVNAAGTHGAGLFVLVKTSNPGSGMIQDLKAEGQSVYQHVAALVEKLSAQTAGTNAYGFVGAVVGATYPRQLAELRASMPHSWILVPGYGSQGGTAQDAVLALDDSGLGGLINNSRGIIFAHQRPEFSRHGPQQWQSAVEQATRNMIDDLDVAFRQRSNSQ